MDNASFEASFEEQALRYLMEEMSAAERRAFEARLTAEPEAAQGLKALADALAAEAMAVAPPEPMTAAERGQTVVGMVGAATSTIGRRNVPSAGRYLWPAAVLLLLGLNIAQWHARRGGTAAKNSNRELPARGGANAGGPAVARGVQTVAYAEPGHVTVVVPVIVVNFSRAVLIRGGAEPTYAHATFDTTRHAGFLDLHNLPTLPADHFLELWIRRPGASRFEAVGHIPSQFYGKSGSLTYTVPGLDKEPEEILVTDETARAGNAAAGAAAGNPASAVVLHGP